MRSTALISSWLDQHVRLDLICYLVTSSNLRNPTFAVYLPVRRHYSAADAYQSSTAEVKTSENARSSQRRSKRALVSSFHSLSSQTETDNWTIASNEDSRHYQKDERNNLCQQWMDGII
ncbi:WASH complex subunit [Trichinella spiralis]|uniref:WASH complex subunit n=1 Tax=Trichinella spiralis TaxID=6334 RepID=A0ABR3KMM6_TRISP